MDSSKEKEATRKQLFSLYQPSFIDLGIVDQYTIQSYALTRNENKAINKSYGVNKMHKFLIASVFLMTSFAASFHNCLEHVNEHDYYNIIFKSRLRFEVKTKNKCGHLAEVTNFHMSLD
ncbi:hypothetical protein GQX74_003497 [Glossina fuscipes]|nr:hypothetical protein GQX74_003497 [Glossina fuscipes]